MYKLPNETFLEYRKRILDSKSGSFCGAKWLNATIWLGSGKTTSCHHPPAHDINLSELQDNPTAIHNTAHKKKMRELMQQGKRPDECEYCWKIEDLNSEQVSDRVFKSIIYTEKDLQDAFDSDPFANVNLQTLEIAFDRTCQFACSYCNANFSSTWGRDIQSNGIYQNLKSDGAGHFTTDGRESEPFKLGERNPYIEAFWRWWPELSHTLKELRITGGEPLLTPHLWKLFDYFGDRGGSGDLVFAINSNLGAKDDLIERLIEKSHYVKTFRLFTSGEGYAQQGEYIRDGLNYNQWYENLRKVLTYGNLDFVNIMMTINALCLFSITDFLDHTLELKKQFAPGYLTWSVNILRFPSFQSVSILPEEIRRERADVIQQWLRKNSESPFVNEYEKASLERLCEYLRDISSPHRKASDLDLRRFDFKKFFEQYDKRRGKDIRKTFPVNFVTWYNSI